MPVGFRSKWANFHLRGNMARRDVPLWCVEIGQDHHRQFFVLREHSDARCSMRSFPSDA